ncbi:MAG TPA: hypothetical protein VI319_12415, partial [Burkholderiales bacterium]
ATLAAGALFRLYDQRVNESSVVAEIPWTDAQQTHFSAVVTRYSDGVSLMNVCAVTSGGQTCSPLVSVAGSTSPDASGGISWGASGGQTSGPYRAPSAPANLPNAAPSSLQR